MSDEARELLAHWMMEHSFATGHGELDWQVKELRDRLAALRHAAGK